MSVALALQNRNCCVSDRRGTAPSLETETGVSSSFDHENMKTVALRAPHRVTSLFSPESPPSVCSWTPRTLRRSFPPCAHSWALSAAGISPRTLDFSPSISELERTAGQPARTLSLQSRGPLPPGEGSPPWVTAPGLGSQGRPPAPGIRELGQISKSLEWL